MTERGTIYARFGGSAAAVALLAAAPMHANAADDVQAQIDALSAEIEALKGADLVTAGDRAGTFKVPGTNTSLAIGGYAKADYIFDVSQFVGDSFGASSIAVGQGEQFQSRFHARQSRFRIVTTSPSEFGTVRTQIEGDFFGGLGTELISNSSALRIRHAVAMVGNLTAGQWWTTFMDLSLYPDTIDFFGPAGLPFQRTPLVRWTQDLGSGFVAHLAAENPETAGSIAGGGTFGFGGLGAGGAELDGSVDGGIPELVARLDFQNDLVRVQLSGVFRQLGVDEDFFDGVADGENDFSEFGWGGLASVGFSNVGPLGTSFTVGSIFGDGVGRVHSIAGAVLDLVVTEDGDVETPFLWTMSGHISQPVTDQITAHAAYGRFQNFDADLLGEDTAEIIESIHVGFWWNPVPRARFGLEGIYGRLEQADGDDEDNIRIQAATQVFF